MTARLILVGGGLANALLAYRLGQTRPEVAVTIVEAAPAPGGNHTWSFHAADLSPAQNAWMDPFVEARWPAYEVAFPRFRRRLPLGYASVPADRLRRALDERWRGDLRCGSPAVDVAPTRVVLGTGECLDADAVIDGRGYRPSPHLVMAYQKFLGIEYRTQGPHGLEHPIIMDAVVPQRDGFRFVYTLPLAPDRLLIEDTYYSDRMDLDAAATRGLIERYAAARGWRLAEPAREETGVLPIALEGDFDAFWPPTDGLPRSGLRAALFHPTTGYSLAEAVRLADTIANTPDLTAPSLARVTRDHARASWRAKGFYRLLDRFMFRAADPDTRYRLIERFYGFSPALVSRFYAGRSTLLDKARVLSGKPPVPLGRAMRCLHENLAAGS